MDKVEIKLPYFTDIYKMHWLAQPLAVLCNFVLGAVYLAVIVAVWSILGLLAIVGFLACLPFILLSDAYKWIRGLFRYGIH